MLTEEGFESFNHTKVSFLDGGLRELGEAVGGAPFMQEMRLCELSGFNYNNAKEGQLKELGAIVDASLDNEENVLVLYAEAGMLDTSKTSRAAAKLRALFGNKVKTVVFEKTTGAKLTNWIRRHFEHEGITISDSECSYMIDRCGRSMEVLSSEIDKMCAYKHSKGETDVRREDITYVCSQNEEIGAFALANAVLAADTNEIFRILGEYKRQGDVKPKSILSSVCSIYTDLCMVAELSEGGMDESAIAKKLKMHEYKAKLYAKTARGISIPKLDAAMEYLVEADTDMKYSVDDFIALERVLCRLSLECRR